MHERRDRSAPRPQRVSRCLGADQCFESSSRRPGKPGRALRRSRYRRQQLGPQAGDDSLRCSLTDDPKTLEELSQVYDVSRERIRQIEVRAFEKLQSALIRLAGEKRLLPAA